MLALLSLILVRPVALVGGSMVLLSLVGRAGGRALDKRQRRRSRRSLGRRLVASHPSALAYGVVYDSRSGRFFAPDGRSCTSDRLPWLLGRLARGA